jgi:very-short-patch-repair endonuclease
MRRSQPWQTHRSRVLRSKQISAERILWRHLRNRQLGGFKFVRQEPIGPYFGDFVCREHKLVVEVDGGTHGDESELRVDAVRSACLQQLGYCVFRVRNIDVYENIERVLDALLAQMGAQPSVSTRCRPSP